MQSTTLGHPILNYRFSPELVVLSLQVGAGDGGSECDSGTGVAMLDLHRLVYICRACLRLLHLYVTQLYPNSGQSHILLVDGYVSIVNILVGLMCQLIAVEFIRFVCLNLCLHPAVLGV